MMSHAKTLAAFLRTALTWSRKSRWHRRIRLAIVIFFVFFSSIYLLRLFFHVPFVKRVPFSSVVMSADGSLLRLTLAADGQYRVWSSLNDVSPVLRKAVLLYEDQYFYWHPGVNLFSLFRSAWVTYVSKGRRQGGSTITMQLSRRIWDIDSRSFRGKLTQIGGALWLELLYSKDEILEAYLNLTPFGGNVEGVGSASLIFFNKSVANIQLSEAMLLAVISQSPTSRGLPLTLGKPPPKELQSARQRLWQHYLQHHPEVPSVERSSKDLPLLTRGIRNLPFLAPHFVEDVLATHQHQTAFKSTLDLKFQQLIERQMTLYIPQHQRKGITNAAAILVDSRTMAVKALVGSADYFNETISGQVNGTAAKRSPGSALKPFAYALALDQGIIHPNTLLKDTARSFSSYSPENFDGQFAGPISATAALNKSRNVPAVSLAARLNRPSLFTFLKTAGVSQLVSEEHYGLGIVLGTVEVTMQELVMLYSALARDGVVRPLRKLQNDPVSEGIQVLSPAASFLVLDMLRQHTWEHPTSFSVAWKTGTSWGFRDAWTVGVLGPYVLAIWVGDFSSRSNPAFVGIHAAAPLFFSIIEAIVAEHPHLPQKPSPNIPKELRQIELCAISGAIPNHFCPRKKKGWFIPGKSPINRCDVHREIEIDLRTGMRTCGAHEEPVEKRVYEVWPSDIAVLFERAGFPRRLLPPLSPGCGSQEQDWSKPPQITFPNHHGTYVFAAEQIAQSKMPFKAEIHGDAKRIYWYVGRRSLGQTQGGEALLWVPEPGRHLLRAVDDRGRSDTVVFHVELAQ